ncbi:DNA-directed RNA polymerases I and III 40 kDa polypeptide [Phytophthora infestans T30-4]|uniref:DNA-directed RNA polymerases I and III 40 kDa polypeptide n=1 Tax=Phytophthora infestans (strain T30-4) TaxID=403677 RepID=D0NVB1_PHYIT|nr:DNA-directed RNA polymerases I and III 40 kDa polypeptide [Phytophthora infestans T30-4]EEY66588.1 DNA-directed RNA polymerases I and III 40 kDa polypeptide [Phytophthora infestans T30-4]|eukprot:XP_002896889.1 DNA-directed RNA polymerases I and III 40 kDa polypeptide [Phytophthora infestans T30-4]
MAKASKVVRVGQDAPHQPDVESESSYSFVEQSKRQVKVKIQSLTDDEIVFDLIGHVYIWNNSSIIQDEVLAHRLGLIPLNATDENTIVFKLDVTCKFDPEHPKDPTKAIHSSVYSRDLEWVPQGNQEERFGSIRPVHEDILMAKLRPGQSIALEAHCRKGVGKDHAKFSPVATASYRLMPKVELMEKVEGTDAKRLVEECHIGLFDIEDIGGVPTAVVKDQRACTMCRNCIREPSWNEKIRLGRQSDHFIFSVESVGMIKPEELLLEALNVLAEKCNVALESFTQVDEDEEMGDEEEEEEDQEE